MNNTSILTSEEFHNKLLPSFKKVLQIEGAVDRYKAAIDILHVINHSKYLNDKDKNDLILKGRDMFL